MNQCCNHTKYVTHTHIVGVARWCHSCIGMIEFFAAHLFYEQKNVLKFKTLCTARCIQNIKIKV